MGARVACIRTEAVWRKLRHSCFPQRSGLLWRQQILCNGRVPSHKHCNIYQPFYSLSTAINVRLSKRSFPLFPRTVQIRRVLARISNSKPIQGGIDSKNKLLNKFSAYHITKKFWFELTIARVAEKLQEGFAKHKMMPVFLPRKKYQLYEE